MFGVYGNSVVYFFIRRIYNVHRLLTLFACVWMYLLWSAIYAAFVCLVWLLICVWLDGWVLLWLWVIVVYFILVWFWLCLRCLICLLIDWMFGDWLVDCICWIGLVCLVKLGLCYITACWIVWFGFGVKVVFVFCCLDWWLYFLLIVLLGCLCLNKSCYILTYLLSVLIVC